VNEPGQPLEGPKNMSRLTAPAPIVAIIYSEGREVDPVIAGVADELRARGVRCAGFAQREVPRPGRSRCDMALEDLATGEILGISQDRGPEARGCRLDVGELLRAMERARGHLAGSPDLLVLNKFGKTEAEGGGFRSLIAEAVELEIPVLLAVSWRNIDGWRSFAADLAIEHRLEDLPRENAERCVRLGLLPGYLRTEARNGRMASATASGEVMGPMCPVPLTVTIRD
jgi:nucleoside-triphosphatase THEP1